MADKWPPNRKLATIFKTEEVKDDNSHLWAIFRSHATICKQTLLFTTFGDDRKSEFKMAVVQTTVHIFQLVEELATRFQIIIPCFWDRAIQWRHSQHCHTTTEINLNSRWPP